MPTNQPFDWKLLPHDYPARAARIGRKGSSPLARTTESYRKAFDALGIDRSAGSPTINPAPDKSLEQALLWIGEKEAEQQRIFMARIEARMAEQIDIARSTKNAARIAAILAAITAPSSASSPFSNNRGVW